MLLADIKPAEFLPRLGRAASKPQFSSSASATSPRQVPEFADVDVTSLIGNVAVKDDGDRGAVHAARDRELGGKT